MYACLAVTCHLHFWQNDRDFLRATVVTRGWNGYRNKSQHRKSTLEKKILPPFQQGFEPATFQSRVRCSNHWAIPAPWERRTLHQVFMLAERRPNCQPPVTQNTQLWSATGWAVQSHTGRSTRRSTPRFVKRRTVLNPWTYTSACLGAEKRNSISHGAYVPQFDVLTCVSVMCDNCRMNTCRNSMCSDVSVMCDKCRRARDMPQFDVLRCVSVMCDKCRRARDMPQFDVLRYVSVMCDKCRRARADMPQFDVLTLMCQCNVW